MVSSTDLDRHSASGGCGVTDRTPSGKAGRALRGAADFVSALTSVWGMMASR
jgi:hypothetical protein